MRLHLLAALLCAAELAAAIPDDYSNSNRWSRARNERNGHSKHKTITITRTSTVIRPCHPKTIKKTVTVTKPGRQHTITFPGSTATLPGTTITLPLATETLPPATKTLPAVTVTLPAITKTLPAVTETLPAVTKTLPAVTVTLPAVTETLPAVTKTLPAVTETLTPMTITESPTACTTSPLHCMHSAPVQDPGFSKTGKNSPWQDTTIGTGSTFEVTGGFGKFKTTSGFGTVAIKQTIPLCSGSKYSLSAKVKRPTSGSGCTAKFSIGDTTVLTVNPGTDTGWGVYTGTYAATLSSALLSVFTKCDGSGSLRELQVDEVDLVLAT